MAAVTSEEYEMESVVRGHHIYKVVWTPVIGEELHEATVLQSKRSKNPIFQFKNSGVHKICS